eukprot:g1248.t1
MSKVSALLLLALALCLPAATAVKDHSALDAELEDAFAALDKVKHHIDDPELNAFLEAEDGEMAEAAKMHEAVQKATHAVMVEEGMHHTAETRQNFFKKIFNCNKCELTSGKKLSVSDIFSDLGKRAEDINAVIFRYLKAEDDDEKDGDPRDGRISKTEFFQAIMKIKKDLGPSNPINGGKWVAKHPLLAYPGDKKFWQHVDTKSINAIWESLTKNKMAYRRGLINDCEELNNVRVKNDTDLLDMHANNKKKKADCKQCAEFEHCSHKLTSRLTGWKDCFCTAKGAKVAELVEIARKQYKKDAAKGGNQKSTTLSIENAADEMQNELEDARNGVDAVQPDMQIEKGYALEWLIAGPDGGDPFPNPMMTYVCNSLEPIVIKDKNLMDERRKDNAAEEVANMGTAVRNMHHEGYVYDPENPPDMNAAVAQKTPKDLKTEDENMLGKIMRKAGEFMGRLWEKMKNAFKTVLGIMEMTLRCSVCVVCNIVHELVEFFKRMLSSLKHMATAIAASAKKLAVKAKGFFESTANNFKALFGIASAKPGSIKNGEKCSVDADCENKWCSDRGNYAKRCHTKSEQQPGMHCSRDGDCEGGLFCQYTGITTKKKCAKLREIGEKADASRKCKSGFSDGKVCAAPGTKKVGEKCAKLGDCAAGGWCDVSTFSSNVCKAKKELQATCDKSEECASDYCTGKVCADQGSQAKDQHCQRGDCLQALYCSISTLGSNKCVPKKEAGAACDKGKGFKCLSGECSNGKCTESRRRRRRLLALDGETRHRMRKTALRKTMIKLKKLQRLNTMLQAAEKIDRAFAEEQLMNTKMVSTLITSVVTLAHAHTDKATARARGIAVLPNACISEDTIGTSFSIAINVENPKLLEWAWKAVKRMGAALPMPDVLAAIMPIVNSNQIGDPKCLAAAAQRSDAQAKAEAKAPDIEGRDRDLLD